MSDRIIFRAIMIAETTTSGRIPSGSIKWDKIKPTMFMPAATATKVAMLRGNTDPREAISANIRIRMTTAPMGGPKNRVRAYAKSNPGGPPNPYALQYGQSEMTTHTANRNRNQSSPLTTVNFDWDCALLISSGIAAKQGIVPVQASTSEAECEFGHKSVI
jgi:hypothetical protein